jgi:hypothetical protein
MSLRTIAAPWLPGWMHQRRYSCRVLLRCSSAAVAGAAAGAVVAAERSGGRNDRTSVQRPPPPPCGRPWGTGEGRRRPPGSYPRYDPGCSAGAARRQNNGTSGRPRAGGGQTWGSEWMRLGRRHRSCPNEGPVKLQRGVTGARNEPGEAALARHLPSRAAGRPISLTRLQRLVAAVSP